MFRGCTKTIVSVYKGKEGVSVGVKWNLVGKVMKIIKDKIGKEHDDI